MKAEAFSQPFVFPFENSSKVVTVEGLTSVTFKVGDDGNDDEVFL